MQIGFRVQRVDRLELDKLGVDSNYHVDLFIDEYAIIFALHTKKTIIVNGE